MEQLHLDSPNDTLEEQTPVDAPVVDENSPVSKPASEQEAVVPIDSPSEPIPDVVSLLLNEIQSERTMIREQLHELQQRNEQLEAKLEDKQERLEQINQKVQEDRFLKEKTPLLMRIIRLLDNIRSVEYKYRVEHEQMEEKEQFLYKQLGEIITALESVLINEGITILTYGNDMVNSELVETVQLIETQNPELDNTIARVLSPAYIWTLPYILKAKVNESGEMVRLYRFILQAQKIITFKYNK